MEKDHGQRRRFPPSPPPQTYSPEILPLLQALLATLADINVAHRRTVEAIRSGSEEDRVKRRAIGM
jgi:hypothetical protein